MNICMVVCNNLARDNRVLREAQTLQAAGHTVSVVGITTGDADKPSEVMQGGVRLLRVDGRRTSRRRFRFRAGPWAALMLLLLGIAIWAGAKFSAPLLNGILSLGGASLRWITIFSRASSQPKIQLICAWAVLVGAIVLLTKVGYHLRRVLLMRANTARNMRDAMLRKASTDFGQDASDAAGFPEPRSRIPRWVPPALIDALAIPLAIPSRRFRKFALSQERARQMAKLCIELKPDVLHAHDCTALPVAALVKKALKIPVVYDAHEIYAEAATPWRGVVDYYILLHRRYLPIVDRFITVNQSIAQYYHRVHPKLSPAVVIRNAATRMPDCVYDGRLHEAAGLPRSEKILLYQGGFTTLRGLQDLVRSAASLPGGWTLVMMGWGPLEDELREIAKHSERRAVEGTAVSSEPQKVRFIPDAPRTEVLFWTAGAALGIIPYDGDVLNHWLCTPNKLWEFPSAGVPLIVQPFPELRKVIEKYRCGWLLPEVCTPDTLADMIRGLTDEQFREAREGCRRFIEEDSWEAAYVSPLTELYDSLNRAAKPLAACVPASGPQGESVSVQMGNSSMAVRR
jgi:glycosyltransferase involved in cell wall biosynthesis